MIPMAYRYHRIKMRHNVAKNIRHYYRSSLSIMDPEVAVVAKDIT